MGFTEVDRQFRKSVMAEECNWCDGSGYVPDHWGGYMSPWYVACPKCGNPEKKPDPNA